MEEKIKYINGVIVDSLQFAETKNAALITFNGAALYVFVEGKEFLPGFVQRYDLVFSFFLVMAIAISFFAFLPIMNPNPRPSKGEQKILKGLKNNASIFYFGHIRLFEAKNLLKLIYEVYEEPLPEKFPRNELGLTSQTITLSRITWRKYMFFSIAGHLTLLTLVLPIPFLMVYWGRIILKRLSK
ncbi:MAG: hypothetical protein N4A46_01365 [Schleiferiaceae bacterium]|jgi:hypothetical protein|nr:hypothetical protein [Schleiferiaceae bacterium]